MTVIHVIHRPDRKPAYIAAAVPDGIDRGRRTPVVFTGGKPATIARKLDRLFRSGAPLVGRNGQLASELLPATVKRFAQELPGMAVADNLLLQAAAVLDAHYPFGTDNATADKQLGHMVDVWMRERPTAPAGAPASSGESGTRATSPEAKPQGTPVGHPSSEDAGNRDSDSQGSEDHRR